LNTLIKKWSLSLAVAGCLLSAATAHAASDPDLAGKNVVLVHGASDVKRERIRGDIVSLRGDVLTVHRQSGDTVSIEIKPDVAVTALKAVKLSDVKVGSYALCTGDASRPHIGQEGDRGRDSRSARRL
jgi:hypothetical protein